MTLDEDVYVELLGKLIGETENLQNNPPDLIPREDNASQHVLELLKPYTVLIINFSSFILPTIFIFILYFSERRRWCFRS